MDDGTTVSFTLDASNQTLLHLPIKARPALIPQALGGPYRAFTYLSAERLGPRESQVTSARPAEDLGVGVQGEFCAQVLDLHGLKERPG